MYVNGLNHVFLCFDYMSHSDWITTGFYSFHGDWNLTGFILFLFMKHSDWFPLGGQSCFLYSKIHTEITLFYTEEAGASM